MSQKRSKNNKGPKIKPSNNSGVIAIKFMIDGQLYKFNPVWRGRWENDLDMAQARQVASQIEIDLTLGQFDPTLDKYRPKVTKAVKCPSKKDVDYNIFDLYLEYLANNNPEREGYNKSIKQVKRCLEKISPELYFVSKAYDMLAELRKLYKASTLRMAFPELRAAVNWHIKRGAAIENPYTNIVQELEKEAKGSKPLASKTKQAATLQDIETIIAAFENNDYNRPNSPKDNHSYYTNFVRFLFATGCRPEDARAIEWSDVVEKGGKRYLKFSKAYTQTGTLKTTKNKTIRLFPINSQLDEILRSTKEQNENYNLAENKLIFPAKKGGYIDGGNFQRRHFKEIIDGLIADGKIGKYITQGNGRHSFITAMRTKGIPDAVIGALVETSTKMIESHYSDDDGLVIDLELPEI